MNNDNYYVNVLDTFEQPLFLFEVKQLQQAADNERKPEISIKYIPLGDVILVLLLPKTV